jgi:pilus assembly protein CpaC
LKGSDAAIQLIIDEARILTTKAPIVQEDRSASVAVGDPSILDFDVMPDARMIRLLGRRAGVTDLTIATSDGQAYTFQVHVGWDLELLSAHLRQLYPDALLRLAQIREHVIVEGQARDSQQVSRIVETIQAYLLSVQPKKDVQQESAVQNAPLPSRPAAVEEGDEAAAGYATGEQSERPSVRVEFAKAQLINLIRVPGIQQVMLQVRIGELNRTALREIGADMLYRDSRGNTLGTQIGGAGVNLDEDGFLKSLSLGLSSTAFGVFPNAEFNIVLRALRQNQVLHFLAEPNLIAMSGHEASFLAGGQFPVPVPQGGGLTNTVTIQFKDFGVQLRFVPYVLDDERIRLHVAPEVSTIDFALGTTLVVGGDPVPGLNTRKAETTVELREGQTLAMAGLLQVELDAGTNRIPGLGDLPYLGPFFSNTTHDRVEKELLVLVTPHLISPMEQHQVPPVPGEEIQDPNDHEFYLLNRIEGRTGRYFRPTTAWDDPWGLVEHLELERRSIGGPVGHSD